MVKKLGKVPTFIQICRKTVQLILDGDAEGLKELFDKYASYHVDHDLNVLQTLPIYKTRKHVVHTTPAPVESSAPSSSAPELLSPSRDPTLYDPHHKRFTVFAPPRLVVRQYVPLLQRVAAHPWAVDLRAAGLLAGAGPRAKHRLAGCLSGEFFLGRDGGESEAEAVARGWAGEVEAGEPGLGQGRAWGVEKLGGGSRERGVEVEEEEKGERGPRGLVAASELLDGVHGRGRRGRGHGRGAVGVDAERERTAEGRGRGRGRGSRRGKCRGREMADDVEEEEEDECAAEDAAEVDVDVDSDSDDSEDGLGCYGYVHRLSAVDVPVGAVYADVLAVAAAAADEAILRVLESYLPGLRVPGDTLQASGPVSGPVPWERGERGRGRARGRGRSAGGVRSFAEDGDGDEGEEGAERESVGVGALVGARAGRLTVVRPGRAGAGASVYAVSSSVLTWPWVNARAWTLIEQAHAGTRGHATGHAHDSPAVSLVRRGLRLLLRSPGRARVSTATTAFAMARAAPGGDEAGAGTGAGAGAGHALLHVLGGGPWAGGEVARVKATAGLAMAAAGAAAAGIVDGLVEAGAEAEAEAGDHTSPLWPLVALSEAGARGGGAAWPVAVQAVVAAATLMRNPELGGQGQGQGQGAGVVAVGGVPGHLLPAWRVGWLEQGLTGHAHGSAELLTRALLPVDGAEPTQPLLARALRACLPQGLTPYPAVLCAGSHVRVAATSMASPTPSPTPSPDTRATAGHATGTRGHARVLLVKLTERGVGLAQAVCAAAGAHLDAVGVASVRAQGGLLPVMLPPAVLPLLRAGLLLPRETQAEVVQAVEEREEEDSEVEVEEAPRKRKRQQRSESTAAVKRGGGRGKGRGGATQSIQYILRDDEENDSDEDDDSSNAVAVVFPRATVKRRRRKGKRGSGKQTGSTQEISDEVASPSSDRAVQKWGVQMGISVPGKL